MFIEYLQYPFFVRALFVGGVIGLILSWMSGYVVMRREVVLTHALSHIGLFGIALAILMSYPITLSLLVACLVGAYLINRLQSRRLFNNDSLLEIFAQLSLALAIVIISIFPGYRINLEQFLFGDILGISRMDVWVSFWLLAVAGGIIAGFHRTFLRISLSDLLSHALVKRKKFWNGVLVVLLAMMIALAIRIVGVLLVAAFVTIPSNTAKLLAKSVKRTFILSAFLGLFATFAGLWTSVLFDLPTGATIVLVMGVVWLLAMAVRR